MPQNHPSRNKQASKQKKIIRRPLKGCRTTTHTTATHTTVDATVLESSVIDQSLFQKVLRQAGRSLARPALEALEMLLDASTPAQARLTMLAALTYLIMPIDLVPDLIHLAAVSYTHLTLPTKA